MPYREVEHTADLALLVEAHSLPELFCEACRGMLWLQYDEEGHLSECEWRSVEIAGSSYEMLLVEWLNEILYIGERDQFRVIDARIDELSENALKSSILICPSQPPARDIKAVTYSDLTILHTDSGLHVVLTFDV